MAKPFGLPKSRPAPFLPALTGGDSWRDFVEGTLNDEAIANALAKCLPISSAAHRWGDELYFDVPVTMANTRPTRHVSVGDIAYWPEGPCLCIFFGKTPASRASEPRPASDVTIVGHTDAPITRLRLITDGMTIVVDDGNPR